MLREPQKTYVQETFTRFASSMDRKQLLQLFFRLGVLTQYGPESLDIAYATIAKLLELSEEKRAKLNEG